MSKENILRITLFVSVLAFNPVIAETFKPKINIQTKTTTVKSSIAKILHTRGLDEEVAEEIVHKAMNDEVLFVKMLDNLLQGYEQITQDEVMHYVSKEALFRKEVKLENYDYLVAMVSEIKKTSLDKAVLEQLGKVAKNNRHLLG